MKNIYKTPVMEITEFENESVVTLSGKLVGQGGMSTGLINGNEGKNDVDF